MLQQIHIGALRIDSNEIDRLKLPQFPQLSVNTRQLFLDRIGQHGSDAAQNW